LQASDDGIDVDDCECEMAEPVYSVSRVADP
jgi:hypothetical protein